jgi:predicted nucleotidyltransferase
MQFFSSDVNYPHRGFKSKAKARKRESAMLMSLQRPKPVLRRILIHYLCFVGTREDILLALRAFKSDLLKRYPISSIALFGSFARAEQTPESDIDILVAIDGPIGGKFIELAEEMELKLGRRVDLVSMRGIKKSYLKSIEPDLIYV